MTAFADDFNRADSTNLGANWSEVQNNAAINSNALVLDTSAIVVHSGDLAIDHYVGFRIVDGIDFVQVVFRFTNTSSIYYTLEIGGSGCNWYWWPNSGGANLIQSGSWSFASGDFVGVTVSGTGDDTVLRIWQNPAAATPSSASDWGGAPTLTLQNSPGSPADVGTKVGVAAYMFAAQRFDDFVCGDFASSASRLLLLRRTRLFR